MHLYCGANTQSNTEVFRGACFSELSSLAGTVPTGVPTLLEEALGFKFEDVCSVSNTYFKLDPLMTPPSEAWWYVFMISARRRPT